MQRALLCAAICAASSVAPLLLACSGAREGEPKTVVSARAEPAASGTSAKSGPAPLDPTTAALDRAAKFERRGVLDRAAQQLQAAFEAGGSAAHLLRAAELYEQLTALPDAAECYRKLASNGQFAERARAGSERIAKLGEETYYDREQPPEVQRVLQEAHAHVQRGDIARARELLQGEPAASVDWEALTLLGNLHWRAGERPLAQRAWAKARSVRRMPLLGAALHAVPSLPHAPDDFAFQGSNLLLAAEGGAGLSFDPSLRTFGWLETNITTDGSMLREMGELWPLPRVQLDGERFANKLTAQVWADNQRAIWVTYSHVRYFERNEHDRLVEVWAFQLPAAHPKPRPTRRGQHRVQLPIARRPMRESFISAALAPGAAGPANSERTPVAYVGTNDGRIFALSQTGSLLYSLSTQHAAVTQLAVSRDGQRLAAGSRDGTALIWEGQTQKQRIELGDKPRAVHFYPDDYTLEVALPLHLVRYDWRAGTERSRRSQDVEIARVEHPHGGHWTAMRTGSDSGRLLLLQDTAATPYTVTNSQVSEVAFALARDQKFLALGAKTGVFELTLQPFSVRRRSELSAFAVAISPSGEWLAALHPKALRVYRTRSQEVVKSFALEANFDDTLTWLSDDELSLGRPAGSGANTRFWSLSEGEGETLKGAVYPLTPSKLVLEGDTLRKLRGRQDSEVAKGVQAPVAANAAGSHFAYLSGGALVVHDVGRGAERRYDFSAAADHLALSASAKRAALVSYPRRLWSIDLESGAVLELAKGAHAGLGDFNSLAFYGDEWILAGGTDGLLAIHATDPTQKGGVHLSSNGSWFSTVNRAATSFVDGDEAGIDGVAAAPVAAPGLYWEGLRREGSFVELLKGTLPADE